MTDSCAQLRGESAKLVARQERWSDSEQTGPASGAACLISEVTLRLHQRRWKAEGGASASIWLHSRQVISFPPESLPVSTSKEAISIEPRSRRNTETGHGKHGTSLVRPESPTTCMSGRFYGVIPCTVRIS